MTTQATAENSQAGTQQQQTQQAPATTPQQVSAADARTYLAEFGHSADALKGMKDEDVVKLHSTVNARVSKEKAPAPTQQTQQQQGLKLEAPKDSLLVQADLDRIAATARERGLSQEQANALLKEQNDLLTAHNTRQIEQAHQQRERWIADVKADKDLGGDKLVVTQRNAQRVIDTFMPNSKDAGNNVVVHPLRALLRETGFGDHPEVVRFFAAVGASMAEDGTLQQGGPASGGEKSAADKLYGSPTQ